MCILAILALIANVGDKIITILVYAIGIRALLSFFPHSPHQPLIRVLNQVTEPLLKPFRRFQLGGAAISMDFSPLLAILVLSYLVRPLFLGLISLIGNIF
ncbi:MAG: YggT family protein [Desulfitobacteriaceae bacterium]